MFNITVIFYTIYPVLFYIEIDNTAVLFHEIDEVYNIAEVSYVPN